MIPLHHFMSARSFRPLWMLVELGLPYQLKMWAFPPRLTDKSFLLINPLPPVPALSSAHVHLTESAAFSPFLALLPSSPPLSVSPPFSAIFSSSFSYRCF